MKNINWSTIALIAVLILGLLGGWGLTSLFTPKCPDIKSDTTWHYRDTGTFIVKYKDTGTFRVRDTGSIRLKLIHDTIRSKTDSIKVYKAYFEVNPYNRIILDNKDLFVSLKDTITQNQLIGSVGQYLIKIPTQTITNNITNPPVNQFYIGVGLGTEFIKPTKFYLPIGVLFKSKTDNIYNVQIDPINKIVLGSTYIKIKL